MTSQLADSQPRYPSPPHGPHGITEVLFSGAINRGDQPICLSMLLPMLVSLTATPSSRWVTWVGQLPWSREELLSAGVNTRRLRVIRAAAHQTAWLYREALICGTSEVVLAFRTWPEGEHKLAQQQAAEVGHSQGILFRLHP